MPREKLCSTPSRIVLLSTFLLLVQAGFPAAALAADSGSKSEFHQLCDDILAKNPPAKGPQAISASEGIPVGTVQEQNQSQQVKYCQATKALMEAGDANHTLAMVWSGVAAVCTTACAYTALVHVDPTAAYLQLACTGTNIGGTIASVAVTKNAAAGIMGAIGGAVSLYGVYSNGALRTVTGVGPTTPTEDGLGGSYDVTAPGSEIWKEGGKADAGQAIGSCVAAAGAVIGAMTNNKSAKNNQSAAEMTLQNVKNLKADPNQVIFAWLNRFRSWASWISPAFAEIVPAKKNPCTVGAETGWSDSVIECATEADSTLPDWVSGDEFATDVKKVSGMELGDFFRKVKNDGPQRAIQAGTALLDQMNGFSGARARLAKVFQDTQNEINRAGGTMVASKGIGQSELALNRGGRRPAAEEDLNADPFFEQAWKQGGVVNLEENRRINLFDRVSSRYRLWNKKTLGL